MEGMLNDLSCGQDYQSDFEKHLKERAASNQLPPELGTGNNRVEFVVQILTTGNWPSYKQIDVNLPVAMFKCVQVQRRV